MGCSCCLGRHAVGGVLLGERRKYPSDPVVIPEVAEMLSIPVSEWANNPPAPVITDPNTANTTCSPSSALADTYAHQYNAYAGNTADMVAGSGLNRWRQRYEVYDFEGFVFDNPVHTTGSIGYTGDLASNNTIAGPQIWHTWGDQRHTKVMVADADATVYYGEASALANPRYWPTLQLHGTANYACYSDFSGWRDGYICIGNLSGNLAYETRLLEDDLACQSNRWRGISTSNSGTEGYETSPPTSPMSAFFGQGLTSGGKNYTVVGAIYSVFSSVNTGNVFGMARKVQGVSLLALNNDVTVAQLIAAMDYNAATYETFVKL